MADKKRVLSAFLLILFLVLVLTTFQWQGIFFLYLATCRQRQQLILSNAVQQYNAACVRLGTSSKSSRVGELSLAMRLHGKKIALAPEFPYCSARETLAPGKPGHPG